jgi:cytochrome c
MSRSLKAAVLAAASLLALSAASEAGQFNLGREALPEEVAAWDIDVRPDGQGLPEGSGTVEEGEQLFTDNCAACHGDFGEGIDRWPVLAGGQDTLASQNPVKTVGSYWPYLSTVYDYINRAMPFGYAQSLEPDQVYAITAYILYLNDLMTYEDSLSKETFAGVRLPNEENFFDDPRPDVPTLAQGEPCMSGCKESVEILNRARILDVTPEEGEGVGQVD